MQIIHLKEVDSTSNEAARRLQAGVKAPFAVIADRQTVGRGRRGHSWSSPEGNLYVTFVMAPLDEKGRGEAVSVPERGCLPLKAAVLCARFLRRQYGFRATLKWPNDILFAGRKLGGLLCEVSSKDGRMAEAFIGLGLNVTSPPELEGGYQAIGLEQILGTGLDAFQVGEQLVEAWPELWRSLPLTKVPVAFREFAIPEGELWESLDGSRACTGGAVGADGTMELYPVQAGSQTPHPIILSSVEHEYRWVLQGSGETGEALVVADLGNTNAKFAVFGADGGLVTKSSLSVGRDQLVHDLPVALDHLLQSHSFRMIRLVSVNPQATVMVQNIAGSMGIGVLELPKRRLRSHGPYDLSQLGADRLAAIEGYLAEEAMRPMGKRSKWAVVVSLGTATTIDLVAADGDHPGGLILPGLQTALNSLARETGLLPHIHIGSSESGGSLELGQDTESAMAQGVLHMTAGAVREVVTREAHRRKVHPDHVAVVLTGGGAALLAPLLGVKVRPHLALMGVRAMAVGGTVR